MSRALTGKGTRQQTREKQVEEEIKTNDQVKEDTCD